MRAAIAERLDVMHERRRHEAPVRSAHLTQRFSCQMPVANLSPRASVPLMLSVAASESFVVPLHRLLVLFAVAALLVCEIRTACHAARAFRFSRHLAPPTKKPPTGFLGLHPKIRTVNKNPSCCRIRTTTGGIRYAKTIYKN